jgi:D-alanyl-D-alanine carboxypeptidase/D-alanyl-D-alanine-endopeptidase (penicillin-binding protein 4)
MRKRPDFATFRASLSVPGVDGTLGGRMRGSADAKRCSAKTGTLRDVSTLAGYCTNRSGDQIAFALLMNNVSPPAARSSQDKIVLRLARSR